MTKYLFYDTETSGFLKGDASKFPFEQQPWICQMGMILADEKRDYHRISLMINSQGRKIDPGAEKTHGISVEDCDNGVLETAALDLFESIMSRTDVIVCHNVGFDIPMTELLAKRQLYDSVLEKLREKEKICTMTSTTDFCQLPTKWGRGFKWPKLEELHKKLFGFGIEGAHDALVDVEYTKKCFFELKAREII